METAAKIRRWQLILGAESQERFSTMGDCALLPQEDLMDQALAAIYNRTESGGWGPGASGRGAGQGPSNPQISKWLGEVRSLYDKDLVKVIQGDAMERCGLQQLLFEPELLENVEPNVNLASTILLLKDQIPKRSKESVRAFIR